MSLPLSNSRSCLVLTLPLLVILASPSTCSTQTAKVAVVVSYTGVQVGPPVAQGGGGGLIAQNWKGPILGIVTGKGTVRGRFEVTFVTPAPSGSVNALVQGGVWFLLAQDRRGRLVGALSGNVTGGQMTGIFPYTGSSGIFPASGGIALSPTIGVGTFNNATGNGAVVGICTATDQPGTLLTFNGFTGRLQLDLSVPATDDFRFP